MSRCFVFAFLILCFAGGASAQESTAPNIRPDLKCDTCDPGGGGGGTNPPPPPPPAASVTSFSVTPTGSTIEVYASNGVSLTLNMATNVASVSNGRVSAQMSVSQALMAATNNDANLAAQLQARFQALLANPKKTSLLIKSGTVVPSAMRVGGNGAMAAQALLSPNLYPGPGGDGFGCDLDYDCNHMPDSDFGGWGGYYFDFWDSFDTGGGTNTADYTYWDSMRQEHCNHKTSDVTLIVGGSAATLGACAAAETGVAIAGCIGAYVVTADALASYSEDNATCNSTYPGPGNW